MTEQEIFDKVVTHLLTQNKRASVASLEDGGKECVYRTHTGLMCAVGCLIPDEYYSISMEGSGAVEVVEMLAEKGYPELMRYTALLSSLQRLHDQYKPSVWEISLKRLAGRSGLEFNPPTVKQD